MSDYDKLIAGLRKWAAHRGDADLAAFELIAWHDYWLRREDFRRACVHRVSGDVVIRWGDVQAFAETSPRCSTSELNVLRIAAAIGADIFGLSGFGHAHRRAVVRAFATATGTDAVIAGEQHG